ncbi:hypothetical protein [Paenibacillus sp. IHB B 3084]|uniref:hypothetical protein n=1 Tax=Paenibacillus sp. IHB B 3084 TaxID=867076 RepID=UPI001CB8E6EE|nr:hypothetical protein [Paenibacillus sp. IHB B 3084]
MMHALNMRADSTYEQTYAALKQVSGGRYTPEQLSENTRRILQKLEAWNEEYTKWWEVLISCRKKEGP